MDAGADGLSDGGSALDPSETPKWQKTQMYRGNSGNQKGSEEGMCGSVLTNCVFLFPFLLCTDQSPFTVCSFSPPFICKFVTGLIL